MARLMTIDLRCCDADEMLGSIAPGSVSMVHADPPWLYRVTGRAGCAQSIYAGLSEDAIAATVDRAFDVADDDAYLFLWLTFPKVELWVAASLGIRWEFLSGGAWIKEGNQLGIGFHFGGDAELMLLYRKGKPRPRMGRKTNGWLSRRGEHSQKPDTALHQFVEMGSGPRETVLDIYAGETASMAAVCRRLGRDYIGAEIDPARHARALARLTQASWTDASKPSAPLPPPPPPPVLPMKHSVPRDLSDVGRLVAAGLVERHGDGRVTATDLAHRVGAVMRPKPDPT